MKDIYFSFVKSSGKKRGNVIEQTNGRRNRILKYVGDKPITWGTARSIAKKLGKKLLMKGYDKIYGKGELSGNADKLLDELELVRKDSFPDKAIGYEFRLVKFAKGDNLKQIEWLEHLNPAEASGKLSGWVKDYSTVENHWKKSNK